MDLNGNGILQERSSVLEHKAFRKRFTMDHFVMMCILSGCDYLPSLPGIGLAKATKFMSQSYNSTDISSVCVNHLYYPASATISFKMRL